MFDNPFHDNIRMYDAFFLFYGDLFGRPDCVAYNSGSRPGTRAKRAWKRRIRSGGARNNPRR
jgi:hypothetical protein